MAHFEAATLPQPEYFNFAVDVVDYWASKSPVPTAMHWISRENPGPAKTLDFAHFSRQSHRIALLFERLGIKRGDRMVIILPRVPEWYAFSPVNRLSYYAFHVFDYLLRFPSILNITQGGKSPRPRSAWASSSVHRPCSSSNMISNSAARHPAPQPSLETAAA